jgi:hypothetical protein
MKGAAINAIAVQRKPGASNLIVVGFPKEPCFVIRLLFPKINLNLAVSKNQFNPCCLFHMQAIDCIDTV